MRTIFLGLTSAMLVATLACESDEPPVATLSATVKPIVRASATPALEPLLISSPGPAELVVTSDTLRRGAWFVVEVRTGLVQSVMAKENPCIDRPARTCSYDGGIVRVRWHDNDTLLVVPAYGSPFYARLDNSTAGAATPTPAIPRGERLLVSSDGAWAVYGSEGGADGVTVREVSDLNTPLWRITNAVGQSWSPSAPALLALRIDSCSAPDAGMDLALFDAETGELREISGESDELIREFQWSPDGTSIAVSVIDRRGFEATPYGRLSLVDPGTSGVRNLLDPPSLADEGAQFVSVAWNPRGSHVLVRGTYGGKGGCEGDAIPPSRVERLAD